MINSLLVLVSLSVYTFDVSNTMFEDKEGVRTIFAASMATARDIDSN
jgi:hypothetical protein